MTLASTAQTRMITPVLIASCIILLFGFSIRASFGLFQIPIAEEFDDALYILRNSQIKLIEGIDLYLHFFDSLYHTLFFELDKNYKY